MKKFKQVVIAALFISSFGLYSCGGPNNDKGSTDNEYSHEEQQVDSSKMIPRDSLNNTGTRSDGDGEK